MRSKAFTILEILVVITVVAVLMGIAIPRFKGMQNAATTAKVETELKSLQAAVESYKNNHAGAVPANLTALTSAIPQIITATLSDPFRSSGAYDYSTGGGTKYYLIRSRGLNGNPESSINGTTGHITATGDDLYVSNGTTL